VKGKDRDPDRILGDVEALLYEMTAARVSTLNWRREDQKDLLDEVSKLREDMNRQEEIDMERMFRLYIIEAGEQVQLGALQDADLAVQFTNNIGMLNGTMRTEGKIIKNRDGLLGSVEIIENPAK
jgi:hypothetical protein